MEDVVESVAQKLSGISGPEGMDSESLQVWFLKILEDSTRLYARVKKFVDWLANGSRP